MKNTGQLYAGLTYGKGVLNETYVDPNQQNRGFLA
jgi:flagellar protein FliS